MLPPKKVGTKSADPKPEPGKSLDGLPASVDEPLFDNRCSRDTKINVYTDKDAPCKNSVDSIMIHDEAHVCS